MTNIAEGGAATSKIEDYALIGDCRTAALAGRDIGMIGLGITGEAAWLLAPRPTVRL